ncbi:MAG: hypothetical protein GF375_00250 [Candidatus Omnitrophica bacterium]|nr:hypothetical protein [Candidatus Omnitrophota bacterium]
MIFIAALLVITGLILGAIYLKDMFSSSAPGTSFSKVPVSGREPGAPAPLDYRELNFIKSSLISLEDKMVSTQNLISELIASRTPETGESLIRKGRDEDSLLYEKPLQGSGEGEIIKLEKEAEELHSLLNELRKKEQKDASVIRDLKEERRILLRDIKSLQEQLKKFGLALKRSRETEQRLKKEIRDQQLINSDMEKKVQHLRERNQELSDGLNYEVNN